MRGRQDLPVIDIICDDRETKKRKKKKYTSKKTKSSAARAKTKASGAQEVPFRVQFDSARTQSISTWDSIKPAESHDKTYATDIESRSGNSLESWGIEDETHYRQKPSDQQTIAACGNGAACGNDITDASNVVMESLLDTAKAISLAIKHGAITKAKLARSFFEEREKAKREKIERLKEERRLKREEQLRQEMRSARDEVGDIANLWREK